MMNINKTIVCYCITVLLFVPIIELSLENGSYDSLKPSSILNWIGTRIKSIFKYIGECIAAVFDLVELYKNFFIYLDKIIDIICNIIPIRQYLSACKRIIFELSQILLSPIWILVGYVDYIKGYVLENKINSAVILFTSCFCCLLAVIYLDASKCTLTARIYESLTTKTRTRGQ